MVTVKELLASEWLEAGVKNGDILLVHSNITKTLRRYIKQHIKITPQDVLESFLEAVGGSGTLLLPAFNFDFASGVPFDVCNTPSQMGKLTEVGRLYRGAVRTGHPIYSFIVIGHDADKFKNINNFSGYGEDSPFAILRKMGGKIAVLGLPDQHSMTFYHYVEEMNEVDYRYHKTFSGSYTDTAGNTKIKKYGLFVRDIKKGVLTYVNPAGDLMWEEGLYQGFRPDEGSGLRTISAQKMYDFVSDIIVSGNAKNMLYRIEGERR